jgi:hypothetical protein
MKREELRNKLTDILSAAMSGGINFTQAERSIWDLFNPGLPPAEGAEEILANLEAYYDFKFHWIEKDRIIRAMTEFATLHAQKIADKMVEEGLREELMTYDKFLSNTYWGISHITKREEAVDEYLKSRDNENTNKNI